MSGIDDSVCLEAAELVYGTRECGYGPPRENFEKIAGLWSAYLGAPVTAEDVAMMMALLKIARVKTGEPKRDTIVDIAGYAETLWRLRR